MKNITKVVLVCMLILAILFSLTACKDNDKQTDSPEVEQNNEQAEEETEEQVVENKSKYDTLILGYEDFNGVFSPFFATTGYDVDISDLSHEKLIGNNRLGEPQTNLAIYETPVEIKDANGNVTHTVYTFKLKEGITFSDGEPVTADDIIFSYKVLCDPTYDGASTIYTTPIIGIKEYRYDDPNYADAIAALKEEAASVSDEEIKAYILECCTNDHAAYGADAVNGYTKFTNPDGLEGDKLVEAEIKAYYDVEVENYYDDYVSGAIDSKFKILEREYIEGNLASGSCNVPDIEGIKKIDNMTVEITIEGVDPKAIWNLGGIDVAPEHYYGQGFKKGDLSMVREKNSNPMGAGAYLFEKFENNVVTLRSNPNYYKGAPKVPTIKYQVMNTANKLEAVSLGEADISDPTASPEMVQNVKDAGLHYELIENLGYGYIGINADRITDKSVRKGLMHLMNREPAINTYYGELASVIERPMSKVSWAYPEDAEAVYPFDPDKALEYFIAAGYEQVEKGGKTVLEKDGKQLKVEIGISGDGIMDHPSAAILTQMKTEMDKLGAVFEINDCDGSILFDRLDAGEWDMWVAAWQSTIDPDMYQTYHSSGPSNHYCIRHEELDQLIIDARSTNDIKVRKELYGRILDIIMDEAVEMPVYQRKNMYIFNQEIINVETLPKDMTPFYEYFEEIETLELH